MHGKQLEGGSQKSEGGSENMENFRQPGRTDNDPNSFRISDFA